MSIRLLNESDVIVRKVYTRLTGYESCLCYVLLSAGGSEIVIVKRFELSEEGKRVI